MQRVIASTLTGLDTVQQPVNIATAKAVLTAKNIPDNIECKAAGSSPPSHGLVRESTDANTAGAKQVATLRAPQSGMHSVVRC